MPMLFKWIFTGLAFWWLYVTVRRLLLPPAPPPPPPPPAETRVDVRRFADGDGEYVDYEEVKG